GPDAATAGWDRLRFGEDDRPSEILPLPPRRARLYVVKWASSGIARAPSRPRRRALTEVPADASCDPRRRPGWRLPPPAPDRPVPGQSAAGRAGATGGEGRVQPRHTPHPVEPLLRLPRTRPQPAQGRLPTRPQARRIRRPAQGRSRPRPRRPGPQP